MNGVVIVETVRRHLTNLAFLAYLVFLAIVALGVSAFNTPASAWPTLVTLLALIVGCGPIGPEFSSGTLQLVLVKPVSRASYLLSRVAGVVLVVWSAAILCAAFELAGRAMWGDALRASQIGSALVNAMTDTILTVSLLVLVGSLTRAYFNVAIYMVAMIGLSMAGVVLAFVRQSRTAVGAFLSAHPEIERALVVIEQNLFPDAPARLDWQWTLMIFTNAAVALVFACLAFGRREVPYGAD